MDKGDGMTEKRYYYRDYEELYYIFDSNTISEKEFDEKEEYEGYTAFEDSLSSEEIVDLLNENEQLKSDLKDCKKLKNKRLNKIRNHRAVIEDLGGSIRAYKGKLGQANEKIEKIKEAMEDTGALTKRQLEEILND